jgi:hypothetical protein
MDPFTLAVAALREDFMKPVKGLCLALAVFAPAVLYAGQIYGTIVLDGQPVKGANIEIQCGKEAPVTGSTAGDGAYRINVPQEGQCRFALPAFEGRPSATVFSSPNPASYNFELAKLADGKYELRRR